MNFPLIEWYFIIPNVTPLNKFRQSNQTQLSARSTALRERLSFVVSVCLRSLFSGVSVYLFVCQLAMNKKRITNCKVSCLSAALPTRVRNSFLIKSSKQKSRHAIHSSANIQPQSTAYLWLSLAFYNSIVLRTLHESSWDCSRRKTN